jgi:hypothetical protein
MHAPSKHRDLHPLNEGFGGSKDLKLQFFGKNKATTRLGRASAFRSDTKQEYDRRKRREPDTAPICP